LTAVPTTPREPSADELEIARLLGPRVECWFSSNGRQFAWRCWTDEYRVTIVELLLQRTRAETVVRFVDDFLSKYPGWAALATADLAQLEATLKRVGLYRRRAATLKQLANHQVRTGTAASESSPGVGQYIGRAVQVILAGEKLAMVDSNWVRILRRIFSGPWMADYRYDPRLQALAQAIVEAGGDPRHVNWGMLDLAAAVCTPTRPACPVCPLAQGCATRLRLSSTEDPARNLRSEVMEAHGRGRQ
jgi:A/G-specific adenine glycosylase